MIPILLGRPARPQTQAFARIGRPMERSRIAAFLLVSILGVTVFHSVSRAAEPDRPNIILMMTDDQGYAEMSCHGNPILATPNLDRLHAASARFVDFTVSPTCSPTRAALMTGRHEFRSGVTHTIFERERLSRKARTLAETLQSAGYRTGIFGKWHLGDERDRWPDRRGFDEMFIHGGGGIGQTYAGSCGDAPTNGYFHPAILHNGRFVRTSGYCTDVFFTQALSWIGQQRQRRRPFFVYLTPNAPHDPFVSPGPDYERPFLDRGLHTNLVAYYAMIRNIDENVGRLHDRLQRWNLETNTLVIFMTDNGHSVPGAFNAGMRGAKGTPYRGGTRVPSFWRWPGHFPAGDRAQAAAHVDVFPTLAELARARVPDAIARRLEGLSLVPCLIDPNATWPERTFITHFGRWPTGRSAEWQYRSTAIRRGPYKLVNGAELYDLRTDPGETTNLAATIPALVDDLRSEFDRWWAGVLPAALENEWVRGPAVNPFKARYWRQFGGGPDETLRSSMDPERKFRAP